MEHIATRPVGMALVRNSHDLRDAHAERWCHHQLRRGSQVLEQVDDVFRAEGELRSSKHLDVFTEDAIVGEEHHLPGEQQVHNAPCRAVRREQPRDEDVGVENAPHSARRAERTASISASRSPGGTMEFQFAQPVHTDSGGRVHVFDGRNLRVSAIGPDFALAEEQAVPFPASRVTAVADGRRYVVNWWTATADRLGLPLHLTEGRQVIRSFGIGEGEEVGPRALTTMSARRVLTTGPAGYVFTAPDYEYVVEVWTEQGSRIAVFEGPTLNVSPVVSGAWSVDNPPANRIRDMHVDRAGRLWLSVRVRRPNWRNGVVERVRPDGRVGLDPVDGRLSSLYQARVDVVDLATCSLVASTRHDGILLTFVEPDLILELYQTVDGVPYLDVWQLSTP